MNFSPFGGQFSASLPLQFSAKFGHDSATLCPQENNSTQRYTANGIPSFTHHHPPENHLLSSKYPNHAYNNHSSVYINQSAIRSERRQIFGHQEFAAMLQQVQSINPQQQDKDQQSAQKVKQNEEQTAQQIQQQSSQNPPQVTQQSQQQQTTSNPNLNSTLSTWQSLAASGSTVADYLSHLPATTLPLSLHHFLKYSAETIKRDGISQNGIHTTEQVNCSVSASNGMILNTSHSDASNINVNVLAGNTMNNLNALTTTNTSHSHTSAKKKKRKLEKEKKARPKPGEIRLTTALDGSTLYCCPECHMAYPEKELLEQHLVGHTLERRFVCDICGAGLKRKDHLTRHKQSHNPERPYICTVCMKAFKRKEQLTLHFVIHSGEKRHICTECGKRFYRKDHLRKHTRSHIARRVKTELSQHSGCNNGSVNLPLHVMVASNTSTSQGVLT